MLIISASRSALMQQASVHGAALHTTKRKPATTVGQRIVPNPKIVSQAAPFLQMAISFIVVGVGKSFGKIIINRGENYNHILRQAFSVQLRRFFRLVFPV